MPPAQQDVPWSIPNLRLRVDDLDHPGASIFLDSVNPKTALRQAVLASLKWLYTPETAPRNVESILLVLCPMDGVAHTTGDAYNKEIYFSLDYIKQQSETRAHDEILGVLVHEVVHCYQYNAIGSCPGGLIEGIADFVRLHAGLTPPHWKRSRGDRWDAGYERTAYFLDWIERRHGVGTVRKINAKLNGVQYDKGIFKETTGRHVEELWKIYCTEVGRD